MQEVESQKVEKVLERLRHALNLRNNSRLAEYLGVKPNVISAWIARNSIGDYERIFTICRNLNIDLDWLLTGEGEMFRGKNNGHQVAAPAEPVESAPPAAELESRIAKLEQEIAQMRRLGQIPRFSASEALSTDDAITIPLYAEPVAAGAPTSVYSDDSEPLTISKRLLKRPSKCFAVRAQGDSMVGAGIENGDILIIERRTEVQDGKIAVIRLNGNELTVKRVKIAKNGTTYLEPTNPKHKRIKLTKSQESNLVGIVVGIIRLFE